MRNLPCANDGDRHDRSIGELAQSRDDLLGPADAPLGIEPRPDKDGQRFVAGDVDIDHQRAQVVVDRSPGPLAPSREGRRRQQSARRIGDRRRLDRGAVVGRKLDLVVGRGQLARQWRPAQPHIVEVEQLVAGRQGGRELLAYVGDGPSFGEEEVEELPLGRHPDRERRGRDEARPR